MKPVSQLAEAYMARKTKELKDVLPPEDYARHLQRVKLYLADNNVYGVDLNPMAVELGGVIVMAQHAGAQRLCALVW